MGATSNQAAINAAPSIERKALRLLRVREAIGNIERRPQYRGDNQAQVKLKELKAEEAKLNAMLKGARDALNSMQL